MPWKTVESYQITWNHATSLGRIIVNYSDGRDSVGGLNFESYTVMLDMLRNEMPVMYRAESNALSTLREQVGEEET